MQKTLSLLGVGIWVLASGCMPGGGATPPSPSSQPADPTPAAVAAAPTPTEQPPSRAFRPEFNCDLIDGLRASDIQRVRSALAQGADPNGLCAGDTGSLFPNTPPLHIATLVDDTILLETLLQGGADVNARGPQIQLGFGDGGWVTAIETAATFGKLEPVRVLLARGAKPGNSLSLALILYRGMGEVHFTPELFALIDILVPLYPAQNAREDFALRMSHASPSYLNRFYLPLFQKHFGAAAVAELQFNPICSAAIDGDFAAIRRAIEQGFSVNQLCHMLGNTPMYPLNLTLGHPSAKNRVATILHLLELGAKPTPTDMGSLFTRSLRYGDYLKTIARAFAARGIRGSDLMPHDPHERSPKTVAGSALAGGVTYFSKNPDDRCLKGMNADSIEFLVELFGGLPEEGLAYFLKDFQRTIHGQAPCAWTKNLEKGFTNLLSRVSLENKNHRIGQEPRETIVTVAMLHPELLELVLRSGWDPNAPANWYGKIYSPMHVLMDELGSVGTSSSDRPKFYRPIQILAKHVDLSKDEGFSPLFAMIDVVARTPASQGQWKAAFRALLKAGADPQAKDDRDRTPLEFAKTELKGNNALYQWVKKELSAR